MLQTLPCNCRLAPLERDLSSTKDLVGPARAGVRNHLYLFKTDFDTENDADFADEAPDMTYKELKEGTCPTVDPAHRLS
eukprot:3769798-Pyramimonas_sp.AAC.1